MSVTRNMELRHLSISHKVQLSQILDNNDSWKSLMEKIPKNLDDIQSDVSDPSKITRKYSADNIRQIVDSSKEFHRSPTQILFDEWGTSGKKRATVSDLLELLIKVELYRAADFVAKDILHELPPKRPENGPCARVDLSLPAETIDVQAIENLLKDVGYPYTSQLAAQLIDSLINNNNRDISMAISVDRHKSIFNSSGDVQSDQYESESDTDLIKFSAAAVAAASSVSINAVPAHDNGADMQIPSKSTVFSTEAGQSLASSPSSQSLQSSVSSSSYSMSQMNSCNLPIDLPMAYSDNRSNGKHTLGATNEIETTSSSISSLIVSSDACSYTCSFSGNQSTLIPDIDNLQIRDRITEPSTPLTQSSMTTNNDDAKNLSEYIPNLSLLNGS